MTAKLVQSTIEKCLVREGLPDLPGHLQIGRADGLEGGNAVAQLRPEPLRGASPQTSADQAPRLDEDVVRGQERLT